MPKSSIDRPTPICVQLLEHDDRLGGVLHHDALGDLELEVGARRGRSARAPRDDALDQVAAAGTARRDVHRHRAGRGCRASASARLAAGFAQHPVAERHDEAGLLGERDELGGGDEAALRMAPAHQRFHADDAPAAHVDLRLVVQHELRSSRARARSSFSSSRRFGKYVLISRREEREARRGPIFFTWYIAASAFAMRRVGGVAVVREDAMPMLAPMRSSLVVERRWARASASMILCATSAASSASRDLLQQHHELVAAQARDGVLGAHRGAQALGDRAQHRVAGEVAERIVDRLEAVEVDEEHRAAALPRAGSRSIACCDAVLEQQRGWAAW